MMSHNRRTEVKVDAPIALIHTVAMYASFLLSSLRVLIPLLYSYFRYYNRYYVYKYYCTSVRGISLHYPLLITG